MALPCLASCEEAELTVHLHSALAQSLVRGAGDTRFRVHLYTTTTIILTSITRVDSAGESIVTSSRLVLREAVMSNGESHLNMATKPGSEMLSGYTCDFV